ncbi:MAG: hypothetical protein ABIH92_05180 [Nanoarchaeota archaeon]
MDLCIKMIARRNVLRITKLAEQMRRPDKNRAEAELRAIVEGSGDPDIRRIASYALHPVRTMALHPFRLAYLNVRVLFSGSTERLRSYVLVSRRIIGG